MSSILAALCLTFLTCFTAFGQVPVPAKPQAESMALVGGTAHLGDGTVIEKAVIAFKDGKLTVVSAMDQAPSLNGYRQIDISGQHIYPGFILPDSQLGLTEVSAVRATLDNRETGEHNPNVRSLTSYNTDSELIPTLRFNGILLAQVTPAGGTISGRSSIMELDGWNWEDAVFKADDAMYLNWPQKQSRRFDFATFSVKYEKNKQHAKQLNQLDQLFGEARAYGKAKAKQHTNIKLSAMQGLFDGQTGLFLRANQAGDMIDAVEFAERHGVKRVVLVGARQALMITDYLKEKKVPLVLDDVHNLPQAEDYDVDEAFRLPGRLHEAGIQFCLGYSGVMSSRNLAFFAGTASAYGLDYEAAVASITSKAAEILGIGDRVGSLSVGKDATFFVSIGDALDMRTNQLNHAFIQGKSIILDGRQQHLYRRYAEKYGQ